MHTYIYILCRKLNAAPILQRRFRELTNKQACKEVAAVSLRCIILTLTAGGRARSLGRKVKGCLAASSPLYPGVMLPPSACRRCSWNFKSFIYIIYELFRALQARLPLVRASRNHIVKGGKKKRRCAQGPREAQIVLYIPRGSRNELEKKTARKVTLPWP